MLRSVLSGETCANCRNCCIFDPQSAWEVPTFSKKTISRLKQPEIYSVTEENGRCRIKLPYDESGAAQPCPFLDPASGCTLPPEEKPFACSLWPLRIMPDEHGKPAITLYHACPGIPPEKLPEICNLLENGLRTRIFDELKADPSMLLPFHPNYIYL